jgi:hypothetical protein
MGRGGELGGGGRLNPWLQGLGILHRTKASDLQLKTAGENVLIIEKRPDDVGDIIWPLYERLLIIFMLLI